MTKKLFVRFSTTADEDDIFDFYAQNEHQFVFKRDPEVWRERIASGAVTIIHDEDGKIMASSISYPVTKTDENGVDRHMWTEIGSTRVSLDGIGLFKHLLSAQIMRAYLLEPPEDRFALEIVAGNVHSKHVFLKNGASEFDIPPELAQKVMATVSPENQGTQVQWFQLGVESIPQFAKNVLDGVQNPKLTNKQTGEEYELDFSRCQLITLFKDAIDKTAGLDFGDVTAPNPKHSIKGFSQKFKP